MTNPILRHATEFGAIPAPMACVRPEHEPFSQGGSHVKQ
jgi:hypothetical protein